MATLAQVEAVIARQHPDSCVVVYDARGGKLKPLGERPAMKGGGGVLVVLDFDPAEFGMAPATVAGL